MRNCGLLLAAAPAATGLALLAVIGAAPANAQPGAASDDEMIVTSSIIAQPRRQIGTAVSAIDLEEMELRGYPSLADVLRTQIGISVNNSGGVGKTTSVRIRGEESYRTLLMIDGVKALDPSAPRVMPTFDSLLTTSDLQRVEVLRGPQGFIYGADAGGVVNVLSKRGTNEPGKHAMVGLEYGADSLRKIGGALSGAGSALWGEETDYFFSGTQLETDGFNSQTADNVLQDDDGAENRTWHTKLGWDASENVRLQLVARDVDAETAYDGCFSLSGISHDCTSTTDQSTYKLSADFTSGEFTSSIGLSNIDIERDDFAAGTPAFSSDGDIHRLEYTGSYKLSTAATFVFGLDLQDEELFDGSTTRSRDQKGYYFEYQGAFDDALYVSLGARYDDNDDFGTHTSARLTAAYVQDLGAERWLKYRASLGSGFRAPSLFEVAYNAGPFAFPPAAGVVLEEETSEGYDVGIEYGAPEGLRVEVTYFDQRIDDEIFFDPGFSGYLQSPGESTSKGIEVAAEVPLGESWDLIANWTNNDTEDSANQQRLQRPKNVANFGLAYRPGVGRFNIIANYRLSKDSIDVGGVALNDYEVLDLGAAFDLGDHYELYVRIENATDESYQEVSGYNTAGRSAFVGVRMGQ
jgi:vitamin B12 transporter